MQITELDKIYIPESRQRLEFDPAALMELTTSIIENGLFHAPVLRTSPSGLTLVSGERRLRAIKELWALGMRLKYSGEELEEGFIPYTSLGDLSLLQAEEAELDENLRRRDLTWQELATVHERLHKLRQRQVKESPAGEDLEHLEPEHWTVADTARELTGRADGAYQDNIRQELIVAKHLEDPEIQAAKSMPDAYKILKRKEITANNLKLAAEIGVTFSSKTHKLFNVDCLDWMQDYLQTGLEPAIDVILTDPPYGIDADTFGHGAGRLNNIQHHYKDSKETWLKLMTDWCPLSYKICKPQAHAYIFCDIDRFHQLRELMKMAGWYVFRTPFICVKLNSGRVPLPDRGPRRQWECLLYAIKGKKPVTHIYPDVIQTQADSQLAHGAQKPVATLKNLLQRSVKPGDTVIDCFAGTGGIIPAAHSFHCKAIVLEKEPEYYAVCVERLGELNKQETNETT